MSGQRKTVGWAPPTTPQGTAFLHKPPPTHGAVLRAPSASAGFLSAKQQNAGSLSAPSAWAGYRTAPGATVQHANRWHRSAPPDPTIVLRPSPRPAQCAGAQDLRSRIVKAGVVVLSLIISALVLSMEIGSPNPSWLRWLTLLPLLAAIRFLPPAKAFACGSLWGISLFLFLTHGPGFKPLPHALIPVTIQSFALLSLIPGVYAFLGARLARRFGFGSCAVLLGSGWAVVELALTPLGLNGLLVSPAHGQADGSFVHLPEGALGYVCLAGFIAAANGLLLSILSHACVRGFGSPQPYVSGSIKTQRRFFPLEVPHFPCLCSNPAQPRAPPT